jgi:hypothetical protein
VGAGKVEERRTGLRVRSPYRGGESVGVKLTWGYMVGGGLLSVDGSCSCGTGEGGVGGGSSESWLSLAGEAGRVKVAGRRTKVGEGGVVGECMDSSDVPDEGGVDCRDCGGKGGCMTVQWETCDQDTNEYG